MFNYKKFGIISFLAVGLIFVVGCSQAGKNTNNTQNTQRNFQRGNATSTDRFFSAGIKGAVADLAVGKGVFVSGTTNSDGTMNASRIMVGDIGEPMMRFNSSTTSTGFRWDGSGSSTPRQMSPDGRQFAGGGNRPSGTGGGERRAGMMGGGMVRGEIIGMDSSSLTIKSQDGGSRLVFYSDKTEILIFQLPTSTPGGVGPTTTAPVVK